MAIRRCPYCKAIIDESSEYCSNCGTRLLFPEDEFIEEEIPGEKIVDEELKEDNPLRSRRKSPRKKELEPEEKVEEYSKPKEDEGELTSSKEASKEKEELAEPEEQGEEEKEERRELELPPEQAEQLEGVKAPSAEGGVKRGKEELTSVTPPDGEERMEAEELLAKGEVKQDTGEPSPITPPEVKEMTKQEGEDLLPKEGGEIEEPLKEEGVIESEEKLPGEKEEDSQREFAFETEELNKIVDPAEKEKQEIERFLESIKKEREEKAVSEEEIPPVSSEVKEKTPEPEDELPPWAEKIKESPSAAKSFSEEEIVRAELPDVEEELPAGPEELYEEETVIPDSGVGIPEGVDQKSLPFSEEKREKAGGIKIRPPLELSVWLKSKVFDLLFIGVIWIVALWFASKVMAVPLFKLISASVYSVVIFYLVLLISYFFLFLYFLGETLGENLFSKQE